MRRLNPTQVGHSVPFDNTGTTLVSNDVNAAIIETLLAAGSSRFALVFGYNGNASNRYLELFASNPSDQTPFVVAEVGQIASLSLACKTSTTATVSIRVNAIEVDTISVTAGTSATKAGLTHSLSPGDKISTYVSSGSMGDPMVSVNIKVA